MAERLTGIADYLIGQSWQVGALKCLVPVKNLKERMETIMKPNKQFCRGTKAAAVVILVLVSIVGPTTLIATAKAASDMQVDGNGITQEVVGAKIQLLGLRDDTLSYHEQPLRWLKMRRDKILPQLIAGLDNPEFRIASGCLKVLNGVVGSDDLANALLRISGDEEHPINAEATLSLCPMAEDARARVILAKALSGAGRFNDARDRVTIAEALGRKDEAVRLLVPFLESEEGEYEIRKTIKRLGDIGHASAIGPLKKMSDDSRWVLAAESYLAMAGIAPDRHGLTADQKVFLAESRRRHKENTSHRRERWKKLAELNRKEIRPLVMKIIRSDRPEPGLFVLQMWRDREALPEIEELLKTGKRGRRCRAFVAAYLDIEGTDESITDVLSMTTTPAGGRRPTGSSSDRFCAEDVVLAVTQSIMSNERKLTVLKRFRDELDARVVAGEVGGGRGNRLDLASSLMAEETDILALGQYVRAVAQDEERRFGKEIRAALERALSKDVSSSDDVYGVTLILDGCVAHQLPGSGKLADKFLMADSAPSIRIAAARVSATLGGDRSKALRTLHAGLASSEVRVRKQASDCLASIECLSNAEQAEREEIVLGHLGQPSEDYALRVLTTCAGKKTAEQLLPRLDGDDVSGAVYAAWVLAQHSDSVVAGKALRRVAIHAMFHRQVYQSGAGIGFAIAPDLRFHQVTEDYNRGKGQRKTGPVHIPDDLLVPFAFDEQEQAFAIRAYRYWRYGTQYLLGGWPSYYRPDKRVLSGADSHLPLLQMIADEDPYLRVLHVKGKKVGHFANRRSAAATIANITNAGASYVGLAGEEIDSECTPLQPYQDQNDLVARYVLDQITTVGISKQFQENMQGRRSEALRGMIRNLTEQLGDDLKEELVVQSIRRGIAAKLKDAHFSIWRDLESAEEIGRIRKDGREREEKKR